MKVHVQPGARHERVREQGDALVIETRAPAEGNRANTRVREVVAARFSVPLARVRIVHGHYGRSKLISVRD